MAGFHDAQAVPRPFVRRILRMVPAVHLTPQPVTTSAQELEEQEFGGADALDSRVALQAAYRGDTSDAYIGCAAAAQERPQDGVGDRHGAVHRRPQHFPPRAAQASAGGSGDYHQGIATNEPHDAQQDADQPAQVRRRAGRRSG